MILKRTRYKILYLSIEDDNLDLENEYTEIAKVLPSSNVNVILLPQAKNIDAALLHKRIDFEVNELAPDQKLIIQIGGHSDRLGFYLEGAASDEKGNSIVCPETAKKYFSSYEDKIECIFFSSCKSVELAIKVLELNNITASIGLTKYVSSQVSTSFSKTFYDKLADSMDLAESFEYAERFLVLQKKDGNFWGKVKRKHKSHLEHLLSESKKPNDKLNQVNQLMQIFSDIRTLVKSKEGSKLKKVIDLSLYKRLRKIISRIEKIENGFVDTFHYYSKLNNLDSISQKQKIIVFNWEKRVVFEFPILLSQKIQGLIEEESFPETIPRILKQLIDVYNLTTVTFDYNSNLNKADKINILEEKATEILSLLTRLKDESDVKSEFYIKMFEFISRISANDFVEIEKQVKYRLRAGEKMDDLLMYIQGIKDNHSKCQDEIIDIIPFNL